MAALEERHWLQLQQQEDPSSDDEEDDDDDEEEEEEEEDGLQRSKSKRLQPNRPPTRDKPVQPLYRFGAMSRRGDRDSGTRASTSSTSSTSSTASSRHKRDRKTETNLAKAAIASQQPARPHSSGKRRPPPLPRAAHNDNGDDDDDDDDDDTTDDELSASHPGLTLPIEDDMF